MSRHNTESRAPKGPPTAVYDMRHATTGYLATKRKYDPKAFNWGVRLNDGLGYRPLTDEEKAEVEQTLWGADRLTKADPSQVVWLAEGEADWLTLEGLGLLATSTPHGALVDDKRWQPGYTRLLRRFDHVVVVEDNDASGREHGAECARALRQLGIPDVRVVRFPELPENGDVSDWLKSGHTPQELIERADAAPQWEPPEWEDPVPLDRLFGPEFPVHAFPPIFREHSEAVAASVQVPLALPALLELSVVAAAVTKKARVRVSSEHVEHLNAWTLTALSSGERKSAAFRHAMRPVLAWTSERAEATRHEVAEYRSRVRSMKKSVERAEAEAAKAANWNGTEAEALRRLVRELSDLEAAPVVAPRLVYDDVSPEKLTEALAEQGGRVLIASPEGGTFDLMSGRYSPTASPNLNIYLMGYSGDDCHVARIGREAKTAVEPLLSMALAVQPEVMRGLAQRPGFRGRGVIARFWYAVPSGRAGFQVPDPPPLDLAVVRLRDAAVRSLLEMPLQTEPVEVVLGPEARRRYENFHEAVQVRMRPDGDLHHMRDWASRAHGSFAKLCGILHVMQSPHDPAAWARPVDDATALAAWSIAEWLVEHAALAISTMGADPTAHLAREALAWIVRHERVEFTERELHRDLRRSVKSVADWRAPLLHLAERHYVREVPAPKRKGRPPTPRYEVNPALAGGTR